MKLTADEIQLITNALKTQLKTATRHGAILTADAIQKLLGKLDTEGERLHRKKWGKNNENEI
tara:strand:+ start:149 stop:334 length:186 start_codon:yes stop_codon:yes gene_type:complete